MATIKITPKAKKYIKAIYKFIVKKSYQNAEMILEEMIKKIDSLKKQPDKGKIVKEFNNPQIRELKLFKFRIIYRIKAFVVEIITVQHSSRLLINNPHLKDLFK